MLLIGEGRNEITQFSLQFSHASVKCYLNTTGGFMVCVEREESIEEEKEQMCQGVFNLTYEYKCYYCVHFRSPLCSVIVLLSVNLHQMQTCCSECDVLIYIFHFP